MTGFSIADADINLCELPGSLRDLVDLIGYGPAIALTEARGGTLLAIPKKIPPAHPIAAIVGAEAAARLAGYHGGTTLELAKGAQALRCLRNRRLVQDYDTGVPVNTLVRRYGLGRRQIFNILGSPLPEERNPAQLRLDFG